MSSLSACDSLFCRHNNCNPNCNAVSRIWSVIHPCLSQGLPDLCNKLNKQDLVSGFPSIE